MAGTTMTAMLALQGLSTVGGAANAWAQGQSAQAGANFEAASLRMNAELAEGQAKDATQRGREAESRYRQQVKAVMSTQRARMAASGVSIESGSAVDVQADTAAIGELDALTIRNNAAREAWGYRVQGAGLSSQAGLVEAAGRNAARGGAMAAGQTLLTGAINTYGVYRGVRG